MTYWLTTQWPRLKNESSWPSGVHLKSEVDPAFIPIEANDRVFVYEFKGGPKLVSGTSTVGRVRGRQQVVCLANVRDRFEQKSNSREKYSDGKCADWRWIAPIDIVQLKTGRQGVDRDVVEDIIGRKIRRSIGVKNCGVLQLTAKQFERLLIEFNSN